MHVIILEHLKTITWLTFQEQLYHPHHELKCELSGFQDNLEMPLAELPVPLLYNPHHAWLNEIKNIIILLCKENISVIITIGTREQIKFVLKICTYKMPKHK